MRLRRRTSAAPLRLRPAAVVRHARRRASRLPVCLLIVSAAIAATVTAPAWGQAPQPPELAEPERPQGQPSPATEYRAAASRWPVSDERGACVRRRGRRRGA